MAIIYDAKLSPSKSELLEKWLPSQPWFRGDAPTLVRLGAFRFDDPAGEVGIETHILAVEGVVYQVPLTYRGAPLEGAGDFLVTTMEHSVLGARWVYDATGDPVYLRELAAAILVGKPQALEQVAVGDSFVGLPVTATVSSSGTYDGALPELRFDVPNTAGGVTTIPAASVNFAVLRELDTSGVSQLEFALTARWDGQVVPVVVAAATIA